jgi:hypothetical protein
MPNSNLRGLNRPKGTNTSTGTLRHGGSQCRTYIAIISNIGSIPMTFFGNLLGMGMMRGFKHPNTVLAIGFAVL